MASGTMRTWDYQHLPHRPCCLTLVKQLLEGGFLIRNEPDELDMVLDSAADATTTTSTDNPVETAAASTSTSVWTDSSSPLQRDPPAVTTAVKLKMKAAGLCDKFSYDATLLVGFKNFLTKIRKMCNFQQEVDTVSQFLRYMQPSGDEPTLDFLSMSTETREYLKRLQDAGMTPATVLANIKNINLFLDYLMKIRLDVINEDQQLDTRIKSYKEMLQMLKKPIIKAQSQTVCKTRYNRSRSVKECQEILRVARTDFLNIYGKPIVAVSEKDMTVYRYYCEAVMVLRHFQCPKAVKCMTVTDWVSRKHFGGRALISISQHKTATMQIALTQEEEAWFERYYEDFRTGDVSSCNTFFNSSSGKRIHSVTNDISRLHEIYKMKTATNEEIRRAAETEAAITFTESQRDDVAFYMAHIRALAKWQNRIWEPEVLVATATLMESLGGSYSSDTHLTSYSRKDFNAFIRTFSVSNDGQPPTKKQRVDAGFPDNRDFYDAWRGCQYVQREEFLLLHFSHQKPSARKVARLIEKQGWKANTPQPEEILQIWKPALKLSIESDKVIHKRVTQQTWKGLAIRDFGGEKGRGVVATRPFSCGDIVCDYHGQVITAAEGRAMMQDLEDEAKYLFFFTAGQRDLCIDAQSFPCECHPNADTFGRMIKHSAKRPNLKPLHCTLKVDGEDMDVVLFRALKDIKEGQKLKFNYGTQKKSFRGDGLNLDWLDE